MTLSTRIKALVEKGDPYASIDGGHIRTLYKFVEKDRELASLLPECVEVMERSAIDRCPSCVRAESAIGLLAKIEREIGGMG